MEIIQNKIVVKLDQEEREHLINAIVLIEQMHDACSGKNCSECPFADRCDDVSDIECLLYTMARDLKYINNNCD
jgi:hypothetical protein